MADYTMAQIRAMQEDAARRVREMNRRSKSTLEHNNAPNNPANHEKNNDNSNIGSIHNDNTVSARQSNSKNNGKMIANTHKNPLSFLKSIDLKQLISGGDQSLLLLIIMILMSDEKSDDYLIYALIYIML